MAIQRNEISVQGIVQGVGFRPFVARLAAALHLTGTVRNMATHVLIEVEGSEEQLGVFLQQLTEAPPPLARIDAVAVRPLPPCGDDAFTISPSADPAEGPRTLIPPDAALCAECRRELLDPTDRRYRYPFITCTNCGPRLTIVTGVPYDRERTTMARFPLCPECGREYTNPIDRRYHAEPIACPTCGPHVALRTAEGDEVAQGDQALRQAVALLAQGHILAIKGMGGYHLACNALDGEAVRRLRQRKARDAKPFAVMAASLAVAERFCTISAAERQLLASPAAPIVLLARDGDARVPEEIAPGNPTLGVMLPYTPLHALLFHESPLELLVMTSGNVSGEPICYADDEAAVRLQSLVDAFLTHNREIETRVDDSVTRVIGEHPYPMRRSRGYVPHPVAYASARTPAAVLACGGHLKNTFCLNQGEQYYVSHHIGDLENYETFAAYEQGIAFFRQMLGVTPEVVAHDLHPNYLSTQYAHAQPQARIGVQHHRAHVAACLADNAVDGPVIGVAFDGTGYGEDGAIWGGEFFAGPLADLTRVGHLAYVALPGGDSAVTAPWKAGLAYAIQAVGEEALDALQLDVPAQHLAAAREMLAKGFNTYRTSSAGRLFDAAAALIGIRHTIAYEGQAAIELEYAATRYTTPCAAYPFTLDGPAQAFTVSIDGVIRGIMRDRQQQAPREAMAARFHETVARMIVTGCCQLRAETGLDRVALSGGVFQNRWLLLRTLALLADERFTVYLHRQVPANDGGLSLGQAVLAQEMM